jgi:DNA-binding IclR family transcriptional regulator
MPRWDPLGIGPSEGWRIDHEPPQGVTGAAWASNDYVFAKGAAVSDATYGLTQEQQERYDRLTGVSAAPIRDAHGRPVGVLTVCTEVGEPRVSEKDFVERQVALAASVAPLIIELGHLV